MPSRYFTTCLRLLLASLGVLLVAPTTTQAWWNGEWSVRKKITVDASPKGAAITDAIGTVAVLVRLHDGNFQFASAKDDGSDIRFLAADDKTPLSYHLEKFDSLLSEAFVWVKLPDVKPGEPVSFWMYYGNQGEKVERADDSKGTYDSDTVLVYHFGENATPPVDASPAGNNAETAGIPAGGALVGGGLRLAGQKAVTLPGSTSLNWTEGGAMTLSAWIKPTTLQPQSVLFSRRDETQAIVIGNDNGIPYVEVTNASGTVRTAAGAPMAVGAWRHLAVVTTATQITLYLDGESYAVLTATLPALSGPSFLGKDGTSAGEGNTTVSFSGELDELQWSKVARPAGWLKFVTLNQSGVDKEPKLLTFGEDEIAGNGGGELAKHFSLITDISKSLTFDGWVVIALCTILAVVGWIVAVSKFVYLNRIKKATDAFLEHWENLSSDLHVLDHGDKQSIKSMGGKANPRSQKTMSQSPLYHIYQIGSSEIQHRISDARNELRGLSGRSVGAIRATLDGGLVREVQRLNSNLVFLTIGIAGGPYLGLLGTVIGVMITFAVIAKSGAVEVNSIAPGIAGALLATVAGLAVAIPALFAYSYLSSRIKDAVSEMQIFIDEFVAKIAEFYPSQHD